MSTEHRELIRQHYHAGKAAFERGQYRQAIQSLETAFNLVSRTTRIGGEIQIWLITAYEAAGLRQEAIDLCQKAARHPDNETAKQGRRLLYILKAPRLKTRPEWVTTIPDLGDLEEGSSAPTLSSKVPKVKKPRRPKPKPEPEPIDLSQVNTKDNQFVWVALVAIALTLSSLVWFSQ